MVYKTWLYQISIFLFILIALAVPLGEYMAKIFAGERTFLSPVLSPLEKLLYKFFGVDPSEDMNWKSFLANLLLFNVIGFLALLLLQELQYFLPLNPENLPAVKLDTAINVAISFITNTNWQSYKSETTMSYLTQMLGLGLQNFLAAGTGIAVAIAFIESFVRKNTDSIGNFWVYLTRSIVYILLPLAIILSIALMSQGCIDNLKPYVHAHTVEGKEQIIAQGPAASQIAIRQLGSSGGGFFTANAAHPYENPTPITDYLQLLACLLIAAAFPFTLGALINNRAVGWTIFIAMLLLFLAGISFSLWSETQGSPLLTDLGIYNGSNMEGKEARLGTLSSVFFSTVSSATSTGSANTALDSLLPLTSLVTIFNMAIGGVVFGSAGLGIVGMLFYALFTMFLIGLMIGRTPEIYGKKLEPYEMTIIIIAIFLPGIFQLILSAITIITSAGAASLGNPYVHGLTEIIHTYASTISNNGSQLAGLKTDNMFYNITTGIAMLAGRFISITCALAIAGSLAKKKINPISARFPTTNLLFIIVLISVVIIIGALTFFPVLVLGPIMEHLSILAGQVF